MKVCTCFLLFIIFAYTNSISRVRQKGDRRGVHLPQKTVPEYSNEEYSGDTYKLDDVYNIKTRGTTLSNRNMKLVFRALRVETLTDFIQEAVNILNTYEDTAFEDFFLVLDNEFRKYHYPGCKFSELTQNSNTRNILAGSLKLIRGKPVSLTKANLNEVTDMMRDETYDKNVKDLLDYINSLYRNTKPNFHSVLNELKYYGTTKSMKTHNDLVQTIKSGVRAILFDHYTELNTNTRRELNEKIETFWTQLKNNPASSAEINDIPYKNPVIKSVVKSIKALKNAEPYSKSDLQMKLKNKSVRIVSSETDNEQFYDENSDVKKSSNEFWIPATGDATVKISSGQSFDSSSNSIKHSQEQHEEYNTQRYMTLYTEEISYKAKTTKKIQIVPISASVMTRRQEVKKRPTTTSTPRERHVTLDEKKKVEMLRANHDADDTKQDYSESSHDTESGLTIESKHVPRVKENYDKQRKPDKSRSKSKHSNAKIISQYDAVIDVQLSNVKLLKSLGMFSPLGMDTNSRYDTTLHPKSALQTELKTRRRSMRAQAQIKPKKPTTITKPPLRYLKSNKSFFKKQFDESKRNIVPYEGHSVKKYKKDTNQRQKFIARRSSNDTIGVKDFSKYVMKRINALEKELNEFKQMNEFSFRSKMNDNNTDGVEVSNVTDKYEANYNDGNKRKDMKASFIKRLLNENHDFNNEPVNNGHTTRRNTYTANNTTSSEPNVIKKDAVNATVIDNKNISQVTNNTKKILRELITNNETSTVSSVTNTMKFESVVTSPTVAITRQTMAYSEPSFLYYTDPPQGKRELDPFGHISDGIDGILADNTDTW